MLAALVLHGTGEKFHARLLQAGELMWTGYADLRIDPDKPTCDPNAAVEGEGAAGSDDAQETATGTPAADSTGAEADEPPGDEAADKGEATAEGGGGEEDFLDDLFGEEDDAGASAAAVEAARKLCHEDRAKYEQHLGRLTGSIRAFRAIETGIKNLVHTGLDFMRHMLVLVILFGAITATAKRSHIALRPIHTVLDDRVSQTGQLAANVLLTISAFATWYMDRTSEVEVQHGWLSALWGLGFLGLSVVNVHHLLRHPKSWDKSSGVLHAVLTVPLYAVMGIIAGFYFFIVERHFTGPTIYLQKLTEHSLLYIHVALYLWTGMLLKQTRLAPLAFDLLRPWKLPPEILAVVVILASAIPTAYSGASGIFVIAAGAVIYSELVRAGARNQLALAATAMSGSLGVVLSPCLLVVIIAALNKQVVTDQLFGWGWKIYAMTSVLVLVAGLLVRDGPLTMAPPKKAFREMLTAGRPLVPYLVTGGVILLSYTLILGTTLNEHTAPVILPVLLLLLLVFDRRRAKRTAEASGEGAETEPGFKRAVYDATGETTGHIGALLMLMGLSVCLGGVIERGELMAVMPETFGSPLLAMCVMVVLLVIIGMIMDPYGAVILVSAAIATIAYRNGINPVHFWMVVLVAFELGYLTPPVALNHLLTQQVVGREAAFQPVDSPSFYRRRERILLPIIIMTIRLLIVAFLPLIWLS